MVESGPVNKTKRTCLERRRLKTTVWSAILLAAAAAYAGPPIFATPDQADLILAARSLKDGHEREAFDRYLRAARYGNKDAQKSIALMYIKGIGVDKDWANAYAWLQLAATHQNSRIVSARDEVLGALREDEIAAADAHYREIVAEYGDMAALGRRVAWVREQKREVAGSRVEAIGALRVQVADSTGYNWELTGDEYFRVLDAYVAEMRRYLGEVPPDELEALVRQVQE